MGGLVQAFCVHKVCIVLGSGSELNHSAIISSWNGPRLSLLRARGRAVFTMDLCSPCLEGRIGGGGPVVLQSNVRGFNHMHLSYFGPQQTAPGRCLWPLSGNVRPYNKPHNPEAKIPKPNTEDWEPTLQLNMTVYFY